MIMLISGIVVLGMFNCMDYYFLYTCFANVSNLNHVKIDFSSLMFAIVGLIYMIIGNVLPKAKKNAFTGLRTRWSMKNEEVWKKCQLFSGISFVLMGIDLIIGSVFLFRGMSVLVYFLILTGVSIISNVIYSYQVAKKN